MNFERVAGHDAHKHSEGWSAAEAVEHAREQVQCPIPQGAGHKAATEGNYGEKADVLIFESRFFALGRKLFNSKEKLHVPGEDMLQLAAGSKLVGKMVV